MKTIKRLEEIRRVTDKVASELVAKGWRYCPKNLAKNGNIKPEHEVIEEKVVKVVKTKKRGKRVKTEEVSE